MLRAGLLNIPKRLSAGRKLTILLALGCHYDPSPHHFDDPITEVELDGRSKSSSLDFSMCHMGT